ISGSGNVVLAGGGTVTGGFGGFSGTLTIAAGTLQTDAGGLGSGPVIDHAQLALVTASGSLSTVSNNISGTGSLTLNGGVVSLLGNNTFTGGTTVLAGGLWIGGAGGFGNATTSGSLTGNVSLPTLEYPAGPGLA